MLTEDPFGFGVAWRIAGLAMGAFHPFVFGQNHSQLGREFHTSPAPVPFLYLPSPALQVAGPGRRSRNRTATLP